MADVNLKKKKRVLRADATPFKEAVSPLSGGGKTPRFRQNGYSLTFDNASSDYIDIDDSLNWVNLHDVKFEIEGSWTSNSSQVILSKGDNSINGVTGYFRVRNNGGANASFIQYSDINLLNNQSHNIGTIDGDFTLSMDTGVVTLNGVVVLTLADQLINISPTYNNLNVGRFISNNSWNIDGSIKKLVVGDETFNLEESYGNTITGSDGTVGTIKTSHASGQEYIDATMWNKKSFALEFNSANSEYFGLTTEQIIEDGESVIIEVLITDASPGVVFLGSRDSSTYISKIGNSLFIRVNDVDSTVFPFVDWSNKVNITIRRENGVNYVSTTGNNEVSISQTEPFVWKEIYKYSTSYRSGTLYTLESKGERFNLTEGLGNEVESSSGTIGTIYSSHASGNERINYGMWQKNGNVLELTRANSDYLQLDTPVSYTGDFSVSFDIVSNLNDNSQGFINGNGAISQVSLYAGGKILYRTSSNITNLSGTNVVPSTGAYVLGIERVGNETNFYADGVLGYTVTGDSGEFNIGSIGRYSSNYFDGTIKIVTLGDEQFNFREGQETTTTGSNGTVATINTSHASGTDYIDSEIWNLETSKWIDYK